MTKTLNDVLFLLNHKIPLSGVWFDVNSPAVIVLNCDCVKPHTHNVYA
jgi:hypothetical protein